MKLSSLGIWLRSSVGTGKWVALLFLLNALNSSYALGDYSNLPTSISIHVVDMVGALLAAGVLLLLGRSSLAFNARRGRARSISQNLVAWIAAAVSPMAVQAVALVTLVPKPPLSALWQLLPLVILQGVAQLFVFTLLVGTWTQSRHAGAVLATQRLALETSQKAFGLQKAEIEERIRTTVEDKLGAVLKQLVSAIARKANQNQQELAKLVLSALNQGVRPLSWEIEGDASAAQIDQPKSMPQRLSLRELFSARLPLNQSFSIVLFTLVCLIFEPSTAYMVLGPAAAVLITAQVALNLLLLWLLGRGLKHIKAPLWLGIPLHVAIAYLASLGFVLAMRFAGPVADLEYALAFPYSIAVIALGTGVFATALALRDNSNQHLTLVNQQLELLVSRLRQATWHARQRFARLVHGPVQSRLLAAYLQLDSGTELTEQQLLKLTAEVSEAGALLRQSENRQSLTVSEMTVWITTGWGDEHHFEIEIDHQLEAPFELDAEAADSLYETLREAVNNAVKNGTSGSYQIRIHLLPMGLIEITVTNPRAASTNQPDSEEMPQTKTGFGTSVLNMVTYRHHLEIQPDRAVFTALIATEAAARAL